jgi:acetyl esterase/lipase
MRMGRIMLIVAAIAILGLGAFALLRLAGPRQLDLADNYWPGKRATITVERGITYAKADPAQRYDLYSPAGFARDCKAGSYPTLIFFHGGSWRDGDRASYGFVGRAFAERGFHVVVADYRKMPGARFPAFVEDAAAAIAYVHRHLPPCADPQRLYVSGHSAGAHIAMLAVLDPKWLAAQKLDSAVVAGVVGLAGPYDFYPFTSDAARAALGQWPEPHETQPIQYARGDAPPLLLLSGDADTTVKPRNSRVLAKTITEKGGPALVRFYKGITHSGIVMAIARPFRGKAPVIDDIIAFTKAPRP